MNKKFIFRCLFIFFFFVIPLFLYFVFVHQFFTYESDNRFVLAAYAFFAFLSLNTCVNCIDVILSKKRISEASASENK